MSYSVAAGGECGPRVRGTTATSSPESGVACQAEPSTLFIGLPYWSKHCGRARLLRTLAVASAPTGRESVSLGSTSHCGGFGVVPLVNRHRHSSCWAQQLESVASDLRQRL